MKKIMSFTLIIVMLVFNTSCLNNNPREVNCELNPNHESCVIDCDSNPDHESCVVDCDSNPDHESCVVDCDSNPDHESCVVDCDSNPDHESCVVDCDSNPDHESCVVDCDSNPDHESCVVDCDSNPDHESCVVDCDSNPDHESCVVDCDLNPDHESCNDDDLCVAIDIRYPNYLKDLKISDFELSKIEIVDDYLVKPATYSEIVTDQSTILFDVQSILDFLGTVNRSIGPPLGENELLRLYFTSDYYDFQVNFYKNGSIDGYRAVEIVNLECGDLSHIFISGYFESEFNSIYNSVQEYMPEYID